MLELLDYVTNVTFPFPNDRKAYKRKKTQDQSTEPNDCRVQ